MQNLLGFDTNPKTVKGQSRGYLTGIMYLAPYDISGFNVCPTASDGCKAACLYTSGHGRFTKTQDARIKKTLSYFHERELFMDTLHKEIRLFERRAAKRGMTPCIRLNGTSDIPFERVPVQGHACIMDAFERVQFYDYTKRWNRRNIPDNYHLTFSLSETNESRAALFIENGGNVAVVYRHETLPLKDFIGKRRYRVVNGFETDLRFLDDDGVIVGLCAKGDGRYDTSGFVRE